MAIQIYKCPNCNDECVTLDLIVTCKNCGYRMVHVGVVTYNEDGSEKHTANCKGCTDCAVTGRKEFNIYDYNLDKKSEFPYDLD